MEPSQSERRHEPGARAVTRRKRPPLSNPNDNPPGRLWIFLKDHGGELGYALCTAVLGIIGLGFTIAGLQSASWQWFWSLTIVAITGAALWYTVLKVRRQESNSQLREKIARLRDIREELEDNLGNLSAQYQAFFRALLSTLARQELGYGMSERISVYRHDPDSRSFNMVARYSENDLFDGQSGRLSYPENEGVIGEAWANGSCIPDEPLPDANENETDYCNETEKRFRIRREVSRNFRMKSCCYAAFALPHPSGGGLGNIAVVVFESKESGKLGTEKLKKDILGSGSPGELGPEGERLARFLVSTEAIETRLDLASEEEV